MKHTRATLSITALFLCCMMCFLSLPVGAQGNPNAYGRGTAGDETYTASGFFDLLFDGEAALTEGEIAYLDARTGISFTIDRSIPDSLIHTEYDGETGVLTVVAETYSYTAENGETVTWVPQTVIMNEGKTVAMTNREGGTYEAFYKNIWHSNDFSLRVSYVWSAEIPAKTANRLLTETYSEAAKAAAAWETYRNRQQAYQTYLTEKENYALASEAYAAYLEAYAQFEPAKIAYDRYCEAQATYLENLKAYQTYRAKLAAYEAAVKAHYEYEDYRQKNEALYDAYERYTKELEGALSRLAIPESMFVTDSNGWQFYPSFMGDTVNSVISNRSKMVSVGVPAEWVDGAKEATEALRPILSGYAELRRVNYSSNLEKQKILFQYYSENYEAIRSNVNRLFTCISSIYSNSIVQKAMGSTYPERVPHFQQFVSQLYVLSCALDDTKTLDPSWKLIPSCGSLSSIVEPEIYLTDTNHASPVGVTLPATEVVLEKEGEKLPEPVELPIKDFEEIDRPTAPEPVANPGPGPKEVKNPGSEPTPVDPPGEAPFFSSDIQALCNELEAGILPQRESRTDAVSLTLTKTVSCKRSVSNRRNVSFYRADGSLLTARSVEYGAMIEDAPICTREADERYSYTFLGWVLHGGTTEADLVDLSSITENLSLTPLYRRTEVNYAVTWVVGSTSYVEYYHYGDTPVCPISTARTGTDRTYTFLGWDTEPSEVTKKITYTALYREDVQQVKVTWVFSDRTVETTVPSGSTPSFEGSTDQAPDSYLYTFLGWSPRPSAISRDTVYYATYRKTAIANCGDGSVCEVAHTQDSVILQPTFDVVDIRDASAYARSLGKTLTVAWDAFSVSFSTDELLLLESQACARLSCKHFASSADAIHVRFTLQNSIGEAVDLANEWTFTVSYTPENNLIPQVYQIAEQTQTALFSELLSGGKLRFSGASGTEFLYRPEYRLTVTDANGLCDLTAFPATLAEGESCSLNVNCAYGYEVASARLHYANGSTETVTDCFTMPKGALGVELNVEKILYTVQFVVDGEIVSEKIYGFGETVEIPDDPVKESDSYRYVFNGWSPIVTRTTGENRNPVYTAAFSKTLITEEPQARSASFFRSAVFLLGVSFVAVGTGATFAVIYRKPLAALIKRILKRLRAK